MTTILGCVGAAALTFAALLVIVYPDAGVRAGLAVLTPLVAVMAFFGSWQSSRCPRCGARKGAQDRETGQPLVAVASQADRQGDAVEIDLGWDVTLSETIRCRRCSHEYTSKDVVYVSRTAASTPTEAAVLASQAGPHSRAGVRLR